MQNIKVMKHVDIIFSVPLSFGPDLQLVVIFDCSGPNGSHIAANADAVSNRACVLKVW